MTRVNKGLAAAFAHSSCLDEIEFLLVFTFSLRVLFLLVPLALYTTALSFKMEP